MNVGSVNTQKNSLDYKNLTQDQMTECQHQYSENTDRKLSKRIGGKTNATELPHKHPSCFK